MRGWMMGAGLAVVVALSGCSDFKRPLSKLTAAPARCENMRFPIYFQADSDALTVPAQQAIKLTAERARPCSTRMVQVLGLADATGNADQNLDLSRRRAAVVAKALTDEGFPAPKFEVEAAGDTGARSDNGTNDPLRRRTEVVVIFR